MRAAQLLGDRAVLGLTLAFELVDLVLHRLQRLVHRREGAQHHLLATVALLLRGLIRACLRAEFACQRALLLELVGE